MQIQTIAVYWQTKTVASFVAESASCVCDVAIIALMAAVLCLHCSYMGDQL